MPLNFHLFMRGRDLRQLRDVQDDRHRLPPHMRQSPPPPNSQQLLHGRCRLKMHSIIIPTGFWSPPMYTFTEVIPT